MKANKTQAAIAVWKIVFQEFDSATFQLSGRGHDERASIPQAWISKAAIEAGVPSEVVGVGMKGLTRFYPAAMLRRFNELSAEKIRVAS